MDATELHVVREDLPADMADAFARSRRVAWDVETSGLDWRTDRLGTCQLFAEDAGVAIVSLDDGKPERLIALLENPEVEKVFHYAPFDLRFMVHAWQARPASIRCTKVASKLLRPDAPNESHSLQQLCLRYLGIVLDKGSVRTSDWLAPTLTAEQLAYAAGDVVHLPALLDALSSELTRAGLGWLYDDCCVFLPSRVTLELGGYPDVFAYLSGLVCKEGPSIAGEEAEVGSSGCMQTCKQPKMPWCIWAVYVRDSHTDLSRLHQALNVFDKKIWNPANWNG